MGSELTVDLRHGHRPRTLLWDAGLYSPPASQINKRLVMLGNRAAKMALRATITPSFVILVGIVVGVCLFDNALTTSTASSPTKIVKLPGATSKLRAHPATLKLTTGLSSQVIAFYALETKGLNQTFSATYRESGISPMLGGNEATVTVWNAPASRQQAFAETSIYGDAEEISGTNGLTTCVRFRPKPGTCSTNAIPLMGATSEFQLDYPPIFMNLEVSNFLAMINTSTLSNVTAQKAEVAHVLVGNRFATCLSASATNPEVRQPAVLHVCLTKYGVPLSFSQSGVDTATETTLILTSLSSTVVANDFIPPGALTVGH